MNARISFRVHPMLAVLTGKPFDEPDWVYEEKYDGIRILAYKEGQRIRLLSRNDQDYTARFPRIVAALKGISADTLLLDGEVVVFDRKDVSRFQLLQQSEGSPVYVVFDCLFADGKDLRRESLSTRRTVLERVVPAKGALMVSRRLSADGRQAYRIAKQRGYEGLVAKDLSSPYIESRSRRWLKVKVHQEDEFVIVGYTAPEGARKYFGALLLGAYERRVLHYVGKVGTGFSTSILAELYSKFRSIISDKAAVVDPPRG
jgi:bifunctional non-homologous end joining protein LigD